MSRACNGSDTRHTITSTRVDQLLIYTTALLVYILKHEHAYFLQIHRRTESFSTAGDTDGYIYSRKKPKDTAFYSAWRCRKRTPPTKCPCHAYLTLSDNSISLGSKSHNHPADNAAPQKRVVLSNLKQKAAEQPLSVSQNLLSEVLAESTSESNQTLPNIESLARVVQRSRAKASGSAQHMLLCFSHLSQLLMLRRCSTK